MPFAYGSRGGLTRETRHRRTILGHSVRRWSVVLGPAKRFGCDIWRMKNWMSGNDCDDVSFCVSRKGGFTYASELSRY